MLQNCILDAASIIVAALDELTTKEEVNDSFLIAAMQHGLILIGNTSGQFSKARRTNVPEKLNQDLKSLAEDEHFSQTWPYLFSQGFKKKAKERPR